MNALVHESINLKGYDSTIGRHNGTKAIRRTALFQFGGYKAMLKVLKKQLNHN